MIATIDWGKLGQLLWAAPLASIAVATVYALVIFGASRTENARRNKAQLPSVLYGALTLIALAGFFGLVVFGISVITTKS